MRYPGYMFFPMPTATTREAVEHWAPFAAFADGPVADTAETVTPQDGIVGSEPDRDDGDTVTHSAEATPL